jgi:ATP-binding cassette subfamily C protein/ATP-binding cassette subfamily C protein LapB
MNLAPLPSFAEQGRGAGDLHWALPRLLGLLGVERPPRALLEASAHAESVQSGIALLGALHRLGLPIRPWRGGGLALPEAALPAIWLRPDGSIALITGRTPRHLLVQDGPGAAPRRLHAVTVRGSLFVVAGRAEASDDPRRPLLPALLARNAAPILGLLALSVLASIASIALGLVVMIAFDLVIPGGDQAALLALGLGFLLALGADLGARAAMARGLARLGEGAERAVLGIVFAKVLRLPWSSLAAQDPSAQVARLREIEAARELFGGPLPNLMLQVPLVLLFLLAIWAIAGPLVLVPLAVLPLQLLGAVLLVPRARVAEQRAGALATERRRVMLETLAHAPTLRALGAEAVWLARFRDLSAGAAMAQARATRAAHAVQVLAQAGLPVSAAGIAAVGAMLVIGGQITAGALVAAIMLAWRVLSPLQSMLLAASRGRQVADAVRQLHRLQALPEEPRPPAEAPKPAPRGAALAIERIVVRHAGAAEPALAGVSLRVPPGARVAITGQAGAGKSTLLRCVLGLVQPQAGLVTLGGVNIGQFDPAALRQRIGYLPQRPALIYGTVAQNLRLAAPAATDAELAEACAGIGILDDIQALPNGFGTRLDDAMKERLASSLGQGIALAQALLRRPEILLLDDPARGLDTAREAALLALLDRLRGRVGVLMVTHRPHHIAGCDLVLRLDRGAVAAFGKPEDIAR